MQQLHSKSEMAFRHDSHCTAQHRVCSWTNQSRRPKEARVVCASAVPSNQLVGYFNLKHTHTHTH